MPYSDPHSFAAKESSKRKSKKWAKANPDYNTNYHKTEKMRQYKRDWKKRHPEYPVQAWMRQKERVFALYGSACVKCGFSDKRALQLDHVKDDGYLHRKRRKNGTRVTDCRRAWTEAARSYDPTKFQILCSNCNWIKRAEACEQNQNPV